MKIEWDFETEESLAAPWRAAVEAALAAGAVRLQLPEECALGLLVVQSPRMQEINLDTRGVDAATDVLSYPMLELEAGEKAPGLPWEDFALDRDPETGLLYLGDVVLNADAVSAQGEEYGHGPQREGAFLALHGLLHLTGYDHMTPEEETEMMTLAEEILATVQLSR